MVDLAAIRKAAELLLAEQRSDKHWTTKNGMLVIEFHKCLDPQTVLLMVAVCEAAQRLEAKYYSGNPPHDPGCPECDVRRAVRALGDKHE